MRHAPRPAVPARALAVLACLALALLGGREARSEPREKSEREPELILPGGHAVRPGQWIDLRWSEADAIAELEILLSLDGGRHYAVCISPQLDPARRRFLWRVPELGAGELRMRIRFNRNGREIEGAPSAPLRVVAGGAGSPEPLGLPPLDGAAGGRGAKPPGERSDAPGGRGTSGALETLDPGQGPEPSRAPDAAGGSGGPRTLRRTSVTLAPFAAPRSVPLRA